MSTQTTSLHHHTKGAPSTPHNIAQAIVIKEGDLFFLTQPDGNVPLGQDHGLGLYFHDCRYLNSYELRIDGTAPRALVASSSEGFRGVFQATNGVLPGPKDHVIPEQQLGIEWIRLTDGNRPALVDHLTFRNFMQEKASCRLTLAFESHFADLFEVRGQAPKQRGRLHAPRWEGDALIFRYDGVDGLHRQLQIRFSPGPTRHKGTTAEYALHLDQRGAQSIDIELSISESESPKSQEVSILNLTHTEQALRHSFEKDVTRQTVLQSDNPLLGRVMDRSRKDLRILRSELNGLHYIAAGVPWYVTLFGRDSLIASLETLAYDPDIADQTLRLIARYQGQEKNAERDEQPGKIMHELRMGEMARSGQVPFTPYYGTIDATALFLIVLGLHAHWTGQLDLFRDLRKNVDGALQWMENDGALKDQGYLAYGGNAAALTNQGWKDSTDAIVNSDGTLAEAPIALVEVQGYAFRAYRLMADLYARDGDNDHAKDLFQKADRLRKRFNRDFWSPKLKTYVLALQMDGRPAEVVSSNPGQALWTGIVNTPRACAVADRLLGEDMFSGWGIRTLSSQERRYNPEEYHLGTVWPHDNAIIAAGLRRYGFDTGAQHVADGIIEAATYFQHDRLPEVFAGFSRHDYGVPVHYPTACHPQAWAAGSVPFLMQTLLGLVPEAFEGRLRVRRPLLPSGTQRVELHHLRVGKASVDLRFERAGHHVAVTVLGMQGHVRLVLE